MTETSEILIEDIAAEWKADAIIDETQINVEICRTPSLHSKYINHYVYYKNKLSKEDYNYRRLGNLKRKYYKGECTQEDLVKYGWKQFMGLKPSFQELNAYLEYDTDLVKINEKITRYKNAISTIEYIMKSITGRDYALKALQDYLRYINGA